MTGVKIILILITLIILSYKLAPPKGLIPQPKG